jgi:hypothetical protein
MFFFEFVYSCFILALGLYHTILGTTPAENSFFLDRLAEERAIAVIIASIVELLFLCGMPLVQKTKCCLPGVTIAVRVTCVVVLQSPEHRVISFLVTSKQKSASKHIFLRLVYYRIELINVVIGHPAASVILDTNILSQKNCNHSPIYTHISSILFDDLRKIIKRFLVLLVGYIPSPIEPVEIDCSFD